MKLLIFALCCIAVQLIGFIPFYFKWKKDCKEIWKEMLAVSLQDRFIAWLICFPFWSFPLLVLAGK